MGKRPEHEKRIYVITTDIGITKIGVSNDAKRRLRDLQVNSPVLLRLIGTIEIPWSLGVYKTEGFCHNDLADVHSHGEWFKIDGDTAWDRVLNSISRLLDLQQRKPSDLYNDQLA